MGDMIQFKLPDGRTVLANRASTGVLQGSSQTRQCVRAIFRPESGLVFYSGLSKHVEAQCVTWEHIARILRMSGAGQRAEFLNWQLRMLQP
jgi:hypothetical protein